MLLDSCYRQENGRFLHFDGACTGVRSGAVCPVDTPVAAGCTIQT